MKTVLLTGANGHIGANTSRLLLKEGYKVKAFVRKNANLKGLEGLNVDICYGDILDKMSVIKAAEDCDIILHTAAVYKLWAKSPEEVMEPAMIGTRNIIETAKTHAIEKLIYTSSIFAVGYSKSAKQLRSNRDWNTDVKTPYGIAKTKSEQEAWKLAEQNNINMISICPSTIWGPLDYRITPSMKIIQDWLNGKGITGRGGLSAVDVRDVAQAHVNAITKGKIGKRYIVAGENLSLKAYGQLVKELTDISVTHLDLPRPAVMMVAGLYELQAKFTKQDPFISRDTAHDVIDRYPYYDSRETWQDLGMTPKTAKETLTDSITWLMYLNALKPQVTQKLKYNFGDLRRLGLANV